MKKINETTREYISNNTKPKCPWRDTTCDHTTDPGETASPTFHDSICQPCLLAQFVDSNVTGFKNLSQDISQINSGLKKTLSDFQSTLIGFFIGLVAMAGVIIIFL